MLDRADRLHRQFFRLGRETNRGASWEPPVDIFETATDLAVMVALPGVEPSHISVRIDGDTLLVTGSRTFPSFTDPIRIHRIEIPQGRFERQIRLESGRLELTRREARDGCLFLVFRKLA
ncbi:MAG: Hsp20/alpha crystallin family protein [Rhodospirillales bacterium]